MRSEAPRPIAKLLKDLSRDARLRRGWTRCQQESAVSVRGDGVPNYLTFHFKFPDQQREECFG